MPRKLPWAQSPPKAPTESTTRGISLNEAAQSSFHGAGAPDLLNSRDVPSPTPRPSNAAEGSRKRAASRTPSTSPPPRPPPVSPIHPGMDADDAYIMVEDEFYSIAQSYTAHLHMAEYKRLQNRAKERQSDRLPELLLSPSISKQTRMARQREQLREKQENAVGTFSRDARVSGTETASMRDVERGSGDLWSGTKLGPLMANGREDKVSLIGLQRLHSSTRAAHGFKRRELKSHHSDQGEMRQCEGAIERPSAKNNRVKKGKTGGNEISALPGESRSLQRSLDANCRTAVTAIEPVQRRSAAPGFRRRLDELVEFEDSFEVSSPVPTPAMAASRLEATGNVDRAVERRDKKHRRDEVPVFMF